MIIYFADRELNILGHASTTLPAGYRISDDLTTESVETGVNTFHCVISYTEETRAELEDAVQVGCFILKQSETGDSDNIYDSLYQIIETEFDTKSQEITLYAEDAGLDLLNTQCSAVTLTGNINTMMRYFLPSDWTLNLIKTPTNTRTYEWDGDSTATERLMSVANLFGCELYYSFVIDQLQVEAKVLNVTPKRGNQTAIPQLRLNYDLDRIYTKKSIADLYTAFNVKGGTPEGSETPIDLKNYNYSYTDPSTGDVYQVHKPTGQMRNISAMARWSSVIDSDGLWVGSFEFDTTDKATLAGQARAQLQRESQIAVNYEVDFARLPDDIRIGDRINIIDEQGELYLEARLLQIETCVAEDTKKATIGEYLLRSGGISDRVAQLATDLANQRATDKIIQSQLQIVTDTVGSIYNLEVQSDVVLGKAYLVARLLNGNKDVKTDFDPNWFKWVLRSENGEKLLGRGYTITVDLNVIGYASTILCRFIRPQLYDLTDHNLNAITDADSAPVQVSFAGVYNQPVVTRNLRKSGLKALRTNTVEVGDPTINREVNLYDRGTVNATVQRFWVKEEGEDAGVHITEIPQEEFEADPQGGNLLARSDGISIRQGLNNLAVFDNDGVEFFDTNGKSVADLGANGVRIGDSNGARSVIDANGQRFYARNGHTQLANIGYGNGTNKDGGVSTAPYYSLGERDNSAIGNYSTICGDGNTASGFASFAEGYLSSATGEEAHAGGQVSKAKGECSFAFGDNTTSNGLCQTAIGRLNIPQGSPTERASTDSLFIIGNGYWERIEDVIPFYIPHTSNALSVAWNGNTQIAGTLTQSSDKRLKEHIAYLADDAVEFISKLKPAHFIKDGEHHVGFYAQDVEEADKWDCMTGEMNGYKTLGYTELIAPLVAYVQKLEERIAELEREK